MPLDFSYPVIDQSLRQSMAEGDRLVNSRLLRWSRQAVAREILPLDRVSKCYRVRTREFIDVLKSVKHQRAHYGGLVTCGSVWVCPVCAAKISERRRLELQSAVDIAISRGWSVFMVTWTLQHNKRDKLLDLASAMGETIRKLKSGRWYKDFSRLYFLEGNVTGTEITHGLHGWHYHKHTIFFSSGPIDDNDLEIIQYRFSKRYRSILLSFGRYAHPVIGVDVRSADQGVADYVSKYGNWTLSAEITKGNSKSTIAPDNVSPFGMLDLYMTGTLEYGDKFREYHDAMKGEHQLRWSPRLREKLGMEDEMTDEELAAVQDDDAVLFAQITINQWRKILKAEKRGLILEIANSGNAAFLQFYLSQL